MRRSNRYLLFAGSVVAVLVTVARAAGAEQLTVIGFNVESGDADPHTLARLIADVEGCDAWGFSEVLNQTWGDIFEEAAEEGEDANFELIFGTTGGGDRLAIVYNADRLECISHRELEHINVMGRVRAPLVGRFRLKSTGAEFFFMVNHLYRSRAGARHQQARMLNEWGQAQVLPVIAVGDYNFDWDVPTGRHDRGYENLTASGVFTWVKPETVVRTNCHPRYNSVLDFVFVSGEARNWSASSDVLFAGKEDYCPDDEKKSDHFPLRATFSIPAAATPEAAGASPSPAATQPANPQ